MRCVPQLAPLSTHGPPQPPRLSGPSVRSCRAGSLRSASPGDRGFGEPHRSPHTRLLSGCANAAAARAHNSPLARHPHAARDQPPVGLPHESAPSAFVGRASTTTASVAADTTMVNAELIVFAVLAPVILVAFNLVILARYVDPEAAAGHYFAKLMIVSRHRPPCVTVFARALWFGREEAAGPYVGPAVQTRRAV